jgi:hypothetical protein
MTQCILKWSVLIFAIQQNERYQESAQDKKTFHPKSTEIEGQNQFAKASRQATCPVFGNNPADGERTYAVKVKHVFDSEFVLGHLRAN